MPTISAIREMQIKIVITSHLGYDGKDLKKKIAKTRINTSKELRETTPHLLW